MSIHDFKGKGSSRGNQGQVSTINTRNETAQDGESCWLLRLPSKRVRS